MEPNKVKREYSGVMCPVCHSKLETAVCPSCGWVQIAFPETVPPEIVEFNRQRSETASRLYREKKDDKAAVDSLRGEARKAQAESARLAEQQTLLKKTLEERKEEYARLETELQEAQKIQQTVGIVLAMDNSNGFQAVATILPGINTYGSADSEGRHHLVRLSPFSKQLERKHFSVEQSGKHLLLKDLTGGSMGIAASGIYVEGKTINLGNHIEVKFLKIL